MEHRLPNMTSILPIVNFNLKDCFLSLKEPSEPSPFPCYQTFFYKQEPSKEQVERLVLANPNNPDNQVTVDRPLTPQRPPAPNPTAQAEPTPPQPKQPRLRVGYVDTNSIPSTPKRQWPTEYSEGMPSWFKNRNNQSNSKT